MDKTLKKLGAYSILFSMLSGAVVAGVEWNNIKLKLKAHDEAIGKIDLLFELNCKMAIKLIKDKKTLSEICTRHLSTK